MTSLQKKFLVLAVLCIGLLPSIPVEFAGAIVPNQRDLQRHCRSRLGFGQTEPLYGSLLLQLRRCIDNTRNQYEHASRLLRRSGAVHYAVYNQEMVRPRGRETQRSLNERILEQERTRLSYYHNVSLENRDFLLQDHRRSRRLVVQEAERRLIRHRREQYSRWKQAITTCRYYPADQRHDCQRFELTK